MTNPAPALPEPLATPRLRLRRPVASDAAAIFAGYARDPEAVRFLVWSAHDDIAETHAFVATCIADWEGVDKLPYVIALADGDLAIGMIEARLQATTVDLGYVLARAHWGRGLMHEAIDSIADAALADPRFFRVQAHCDADNVPSQRALEKAGFAREARIERFGVHPNVSPEPRACFLYGRWR